MKKLTEATTTQLNGKKWETNLFLIVSDILPEYKKVFENILEKVKNHGN